MKKILLAYILIMILLLCSCRQTNNNDYESSSNSSAIITSENSSAANNSSLPERDNPSNSSSNNGNHGNSSGHDGQYSSETEPDEEVSLYIYVDYPYYRQDVKTITFTLYNQKKNAFNYTTDFFLQIHNGEDWQYYPTKNGDIEYKFITAESDSYRKKVIFDLRNLYNLPLDTGTYRIIQETDNGVVTSDMFDIVDDSFFGGEQIH